MKFMFCPTDTISMSPSKVVRGTDAHREELFRYRSKAEQQNCHQIRETFLTSSKNKMNRIEFPISDWCLTMPEKLTDTQTLCIGTPEGKAIWITHTGHRECTEYECDHEEADSRIFVDSPIFSRRFAGQQKHTIIFTPDTVLAVLCCYHFPSLGVDELWFHSPGGQKRLIPIHTTVQELGPTICTILPALHALSGCDSTSSLYGTGKKKAMQALKSNIASLDKLVDMGSHPSTVTPECMEACKC